MIYALFYFTINYILNEVDYLNSKLPSWYCFKCFTFWGCGIILLLSGSNLFEAVGIAGVLSFLTTLYDRSI
jgi:hypothetical protein